MLDQLGGRIVKLMDKSDDELKAIVNQIIELPPKKVSILSFFQKRE